MTSYNNTHKPCPHPDCDSSDAFSYDPSEGIGNCFSCNNGYPKKGVKYSEDMLEEYPLKNEGFQKDDYAVETQPTTTGIPLSQQMTTGMEKGFLPSRAISEKTMAYYDVETFFGKGQPNVQIYKYPSGGLKIRTFPKSFKAENLQMDELFGMDVFPRGCNQRVIICEGELDAMSAYQMTGIPAVSVTSATLKDTLFDNVRQWLTGFDKIILSFDNDKAGAEATNRFAAEFMDQVSIADHGEFKDANEFLQAGKDDDYKGVVYTAKPWSPPGIKVTADDFMRDINVPKPKLYPSGIPELDEMLEGGLHKDRTTLIRGTTGVGKTEVSRMFEYQLLKSGARVLSIHMEETNRLSILALMSYYLDKNCRDVFADGDEKLLKEVGDAVGELTDERQYALFSINPGETESVQSQINTYLDYFKPDFIVLEPVQDAIWPTDKKREQALSEFANFLHEVAAERQIGVIAIAHQNKSTNNDPIGSTKYCSFLDQKFSFVMDVNRVQEDVDCVSPEHNLRRIYLSKNRLTGKIGHAGEVRWHEDVKKLTDIGLAYNR